MIDFIAKGLLGISVAVLGAVAALIHDPVPQPIPVAEFDYSDVQLSPTASIQADHLKRLELQIKEQRERAARINGKLDLLLEPGEGKGAGRKPRQK